MKNGIGRIATATFTYGFLGLMAFLSIFPFIWMVLGASNSSIDIIKGRILPGDLYIFLSLGRKFHRKRLCAAKL